MVGVLTFISNCFSNFSLILCPFCESLVSISSSSGVQTRVPQNRHGPDPSCCGEERGRREGKEGGRRGEGKGEREGSRKGREKGGRGKREGGREIIGARTERERGERGRDLPRNC